MLLLIGEVLVVGHNIRFLLAGFSFKNERDVYVHEEMCGSTWASCFGALTRAQKLMTVRVWWMLCAASGHRTSAGLKERSKWVAGLWSNIVPVRTGEVALAPPAIGI